MRDDDDNDDDQIISNKTMLIETKRDIVIFKLRNTKYTGKNKNKLVILKVPFP